MNIKCDMCDGTGKYWVAPSQPCRNCNGSGKISITSPTKEDKEWWLECYGKQAGSNYGKWLLFINKNNIDETWKKIRQDTIDEKLGVGSKVSTRKGWMHHGMPQDYVICVYTPKEKVEVDRVRNRLRELGFTGKIGYKTNQETINDTDELLYQEQL